MLSEKIEELQKMTERGIHLEEKKLLELSVASNTILEVLRLYAMMSSGIERRDAVKQMVVFCNYYSCCFLRRLPPSAVGTPVVGYDASAKDLSPEGSSESEILKNITYWSWYVHYHRSVTYLIR